MRTSSAAAASIRAARPTHRTLIVEGSSVLVRGYDELALPIQHAIRRVLREVELPLTFASSETSTLVVPRNVIGRGREHDMAQLLGRCIRPPGRKQVALERIRSDRLVRDYPERLDPDEICRRGHAFADCIEARRDALTEVLVRYETHLVARDEMARTLDLMRSLRENRGYFRRRIGEVASFLPRNQPLYALACFGLVPAMMSRRVHVRPPRAMSHIFGDLATTLELERHAPNVSLSFQERAEFIAERSAVRVDDRRRRIPVTDAVIFTGSYQNARDVLKHFDRNVLMIVNGAGHNPIVVSETADVERAVASAVRVQLYNQGQDCANPSAILVHRRRYEEFVSRLRDELKEVRVGPYDDPDVTVGPISRRRDLQRIQAILADNWRWLDDRAEGVIRIGSSIVEPTILLKPLSEGGNFSEQLAPVFFVQRYDEDAALCDYFEDPRYPLHAMYVTVFGSSAYVDGLTRRSIRGAVLHDEGTIIRDTDLHAPGVERGTQPYGGYGPGASSLHLSGVTTARPTLPQRDLYEALVRPSLSTAEPEPATPRITPSPEKHLGALEARYLDAATAPVYRGNTSIEPLVDGAEYLGAVRRNMASTRGAADAIFLLAYQLDPSWNLSEEPSLEPLGQLLAARAAAGVDVRVILNGTRTPQNPWRENRAAAKRLRSWRIGDATPLADRVLVDRSGATFTGSHHQKMILVHSRGDVTAFISGMDPVPDHWDRRPHGGPLKKRWPDGSPWGWHDLGVCVRGEAVRGVWDHFCERWAQVNRTASRRPRRSVRTPGPSPRPRPRTSSQSVQILRSAFDWKGGPVREIYLALRKAIAAAERYIYIEDQFLCDRGPELFGVPLPAGGVRIPAGYSLFGDIAARLRAHPLVRVVFVGSGKSDPIDPVPGARNIRLTPSLRRLMAQLSAEQRRRVAVWRVNDVTVHSKLVLIDDELAAMGSANFRARSFFGIDDELQVAVVAADHSIARLRRRLWAELFALEGGEEITLNEVDDALERWFSPVAGPRLGRVTEGAPSRAPPRPSA